MTQDDKISLRIVAVLLTLCALWGWGTHQQLLGVAVAAPILIVVLFAWQFRAYSADWLAQIDTTEFVFRRPLVFRVYNGSLVLLFGAISIAALFLMHPPFSMPLSLAWCIMLIFLLLSVMGLSMTAPMMTAFDLSRQEYIKTWGFVPFQHTAQGSTKDGEFRVTKSSNLGNVLFFQPTGGRQRFFVAFCASSKQMDAVQQLADALGVRVERKT